MEMEINLEELEVFKSMDEDTKEMVESYWKRRKRDYTLC